MMNITTGRPLVKKGFNYLNFNVLEITELRDHGRWKIVMTMTTLTMFLNLLMIEWLEWLKSNLWCTPVSHYQVWWEILVRIVSFPCRWMSCTFKIWGIADTCYRFTVPCSLDPMLHRCSWFYLWLSVLFGVDEGATSRVKIKSVSLQDSVQISGLYTSIDLLY